MSRRLTHRLGPVTGVAGTALLFTGLMVTNGATDAMSVTDPSAIIAADYFAHRDTIRLGVHLALVGTALLIWFLAYVRRRVRAAEGEGGWLASVLWGGGVIGLAGVLVHLGVLLAATNDSIAGAPATAQTLLTMSWEFGGVLAPAFAALVGATSVAILRYRILPRGPAWLGLPLAVALGLSGLPGGGLVVLALLWLGAIAVCLLLWPEHAQGVVKGARPAKVARELRV